MKVIPVLVKPDGTYSNDSTFLILELESHPSRPIVSKNLGHAFLSALLEDFSDEWMTKTMFEGRFHTREDGMFGAAWQTMQSPETASMDQDFVHQSISAFASRQIKRRPAIGSSDWDAMQRTLRCVCEALEANLRAGQQFLFGNSGPSRSASPPVHLPSAGVTRRPLCRPCQQRGLRVVRAAADERHRPAALQAHGRLPRRLRVGVAHGRPERIRAQR